MSGSRNATVGIAAVRCWSLNMPQLCGGRSFQGSGVGGTHMAQSSQQSFSVSVELDLHGCTVKQAMEKFACLYNERVGEGKLGSPIVVIHGDNHGDRIKRRLRAFLNKHKDSLSFQYGEDREQNPGCTWVWPRQLLPSTDQILADKILEYCQSPKTTEKIFQECRHHEFDELGIARLIRSLVKSGHLIEVNNGRRLYRTAHVD